MLMKRKTLENKISKLNKTLEECLKLNKYKFIVDGKKQLLIISGKKRSIKELQKQLKQLNKKERDATLTKLLSTPEGIKLLAQSMANPIRHRLDYEGVGRKACIVEPLPEGALAYYDRDIEL